MLRVEEEVGTKQDSFFFSAAAPTGFYTHSLPDSLPICPFLVAWSPLPPSLPPSLPTSSPLTSLPSPRSVSLVWRRCPV